MRCWRRHGLPALPHQRPDMATKPTRSSQRTDGASPTQPACCRPEGGGSWRHERGGHPPCQRIRIELLGAPGTLRSVKRRVSQIELRTSNEHVGLDPGDSLRNGKVDSQIGILDAHLARRSSSSLSSSMILALSLIHISEPTRPY